MWSSVSRARMHASVAFVLDRIDHALYCCNKHNLGHRIHTACMKCAFFCWPREGRRQAAAAAAACCGVLRRAVAARSALGSEQVCCL